MSETTTIDDTDYYESQEESTSPKPTILTDEEMDSYHVEKCKQSQESYLQQLSECALEILHIEDRKKENDDHEKEMYRKVINYLELINQYDDRIYELNGTPEADMHEVRVTIEKLNAKSNKRRALLQNPHRLYKQIVDLKKRREELRKPKQYCNLFGPILEKTGKGLLWLAGVVSGYNTVLEEEHLRSLEDVTIDNAIYHFEKEDSLKIKIPKLLESLELSSERVLSKRRAKKEIRRKKW